VFFSRGRKPKALVTGLSVLPLHCAECGLDVTNVLGHLRLHVVELDLRLLAAHDHECEDGGRSGEVES